MAKKRSKLAFASNLRRVLSKAKLPTLANRSEWEGYFAQWGWKFSEEILNRFFEDRGLSESGFSEKEREYLRKLSHTGISHYRGSPTLRKLCDFLGITIESLWDESDPQTAEKIQWREREKEWRAREERLRAAPKQIAVDLIGKYGNYGARRDAFEDLIWKMKREFFELLDDYHPDPLYDEPLYSILLDEVKRELGGNRGDHQTGRIREIVAAVNRPLDCPSLPAFYARAQKIAAVIRTYENAHRGISIVGLAEVIATIFPPEPVQAEPQQSEQRSEPSPVTPIAASPAVDAPATPAATAAHAVSFGSPDEDRLDRERELRKLLQEQEEEMQEETEAERIDMPVVEYRERRNDRYRRPRHKTR